MEPSIPSRYLQAMESERILPNFWCSLEYWRRAGVSFAVSFNGTITVTDAEGHLFLPLLCQSGFCTEPLAFAAFPDFPGEVVDRQYIYSPGLPEMSGTDWKPIRSTMRRVDRKLGSLSLSLLRPKEDVKRTASLLYAWARSQGEPLYDPELMADFVLNGDHRLALRDDNGVLWGVLVWDANYKYTNFRYCIVSGEVEGLSDVARLLFREWCGEHHPNRLINDGGDLDRPGLRRYKMKFQPSEVHIIRGKAS